MVKVWQWDCYQMVNKTMHLRTWAGVEKERKIAWKTKARRVTSGQL